MFRFFNIWTVSELFSILSIRSPPPQFVFNKIALINFNYFTEVLHPEILCYIPIPFSHSITSVYNSVKKSVIFLPSQSCGLDFIANMFCTFQILRGLTIGLKFLNYLLFKKHCTGLSFLVSLVGL